MNTFKSEFSNKKIDNIKIIKYLSEKEIDQLKEKYRISVYFKVKRQIKIFFFGFLKFFLNTNPILKSRSLEEVKNKYENISGTYIKSYLSKNRSFYADIDGKQVVELKGGLETYYTEHISNIIKKKKISSFLEVGAGEMTLMYDLLKKIKNKKIKPMGALDIAFQRLEKGKKFLKKRKISLDYIVKGDAANIPFADNSFDLIYTSHCLEQVPHLFNDILKECIRVSKKYVVLIEPSYEFGSSVTKDHIYKKGYPKISNKLFKQDNYKIIFRKGLPIKSYINGSEIIVLKKQKDKKKIKKKYYICPNCKEELRQNKKKLICQKEKIFYPIKSNISLLEKNDGKSF